MEISLYLNDKLKLWIETVVVEFFTRFKPKFTLQKAKTSSSHKNSTSWFSCAYAPACKKHKETALARTLLNGFSGFLNFLLYLQVKHMQVNIYFNC